MQMKIEISNITEGEKQAIEELFAQWEYLGASSTGYHLTALLAGGKFRPEVKIDGRPAKLCTLADRSKKAMYWVEYEHGPGTIYKIDPEEVDILLANSRAKERSNGKQK